MTYRSKRTLEEFYGSTLQPTSVLISQAHTSLEELAAGTHGFRTGLANLDSYIHLAPGDFNLLAGRAGSGKTAAMIQIAYNIMAQNQLRRVEGGAPGAIAVFSAEMDASSLLLREACARERISLWKLQQGKASEAEVKRLGERLDTLSSDDLFIDPSSAPTLEHMTQQLAALEEGPGVSAMLFDYLELAGEYDRQESLRVRKISRGVKAIAKRFHIPVLALGQLNRESEKSDAPSLRHIMHGGEQEMDRVVALIPSESAVSGLREGETLMEIHILKNRNGPTGQTYLKYVGPTMRYTDAEVEQRPMQKGET